MNRMDESIRFFYLHLAVIPVDPDLSGDEPKSIRNYVFLIPCQARIDNFLVLDKINSFPSP